MQRDVEVVINIVLPNVCGFLVPVGKIYMYSVSWVTNSKASNC